jgi:hypothetical protein
MHAMHTHHRPWMGDRPEFHVVCTLLDKRSLLLHPLVRPAYAAEDLGQRLLDKA